MSTIQGSQNITSIPYQPSLKEKALYCVQKVWEAVKNFFSSCCPPRIREFFIGSVRESQIRLQDLQQEVTKYRTGVPLTAREIVALQKKKNAADAVFKRAASLANPHCLTYVTSTEPLLNILLRGQPLARNPNNRLRK